MRKKWKITLFTILSLAFIFLCFVGWWAISNYNELSNAKKTKEESRFGQFEEKPEYKPPEWEGSERVNVLLMGGDERGLREGEVARSDTMLVASFDPVSKSIHLFSVLRDTHVEIPGYKDNRVNAAITLGGPELTMKTIGNLTGLDIQYYVYVDFQGFIKLVDALGGVDFYVEKDMKYTDSADDHKFDIDLKKGQQHLDGDKALQYVRFRHDKLSDFTRTERQREFLKAVAAKVKSGWNLIKLPDILGEVIPYVETNMTVNDMLKLGTLGYNSHQAGSAQIPPMELVTDEKVNGSAVLGVRSLDALKGYVQEVLNKDESLATPSPSPSSSGAASSATNAKQ
ncbi:LCP family protein [Cohnella herbarum]|uniref:LCP family protein n=1 Tax=Cohnella herbarum TaxID=2728023 RepID=A0A7Z2ZMB1_9BACL|nr:LCP family protein [Cohnella herbarum]QJD84784.1 LCP family protein [Cohnella herbarum]